MYDHRIDGMCAIPPHPKLLNQIRANIAVAKGQSNLPHLKVGLPRRPGMNDGIVHPPRDLPLGVSLAEASTALFKMQPRGTVNVFVVLVDFPDIQHPQNSDQRIKDLFFSTGAVPTGSIREFYTEVTNGIVTIAGTVQGPIQLPHPSTFYTANHQGFGGPGLHSSQDMAQDVLTALGPAIDYGPYDNNGDGLVDAFVIVHAGTGAEETNKPNDFWSLKWTLPQQFSGTNANVYGFLTIPQDCRLGVSAHELGHLLFGFPDLYDIGDTSVAGAGDWCLMAGGSWNGATPGDTPAHPSAWCKVQQSWVSTTEAPNGTSPLNLASVETSHQVINVWDGASRSSEYFLLETRAKVGFDAALPSEGLLIWHIDESVANQDNPLHFKVTLEQADNQADLELPNGNRGDPGDPYPGATANTAFTPTSAPPAESFSGTTKIAITNIAFAAGVTTGTLTI